AGTPVRGLPQAARAAGTPVYGAPVVPPPPPPPSPPEPVRSVAPPVLAPSIAPAKAFNRRADAAPPPYPSAKPSREEAPPPAAPPLALGDAPVERTDPRIAYTGNVNRKVLDALKKVKRADPVTSASPASASARDDVNAADVLARDSLQVALRMEQGGRLDEAIRFLERSIAQSPDAPSLYNRLGIILMRERSDLRRAEEMIRKATELAPDNAVYAANLRQVISQQALKRR
ncbi:MAG: tetratricopeptide repeat protein, partial [Myxococcota bacterium]